MSITATCMLLRNEEEEFSFRLGERGGSSWKQKIKFFLLLSHDLFCPTPLDQGGTYYKRLYAKRGFGFGRQKRKGKEEEERGGGRGLKTPP